MRPAVFLDRDGTICEEVGYLNHIERFRLFPWTASAIHKLNRSGLAAVVLTNQSGVARGYFPETFVSEVHDRLKSDLAASEAWIDGIYYCPHHPDGTISQFRRVCQCRKPGIGMLLKASEELDLQPQASFAVGDRYNDIQMGFNAGARTVMVLSGYGRGEYCYHSETWPRQPDHVAENLESAVDWILAQEQPIPDP